MSILLNIGIVFWLKFVNCPCARNCNGEEIALNMGLIWTCNAGLAYPFDEFCISTVIVSAFLLEQTDALCEWGKSYTALYQRQWCEIRALLCT